MRKQDGAGIRRMGSALSRVAVLRAGGLCARGRRPHAPGSQCTRVTIRVARGPAQNAKQLLRPLSLPTGERTRGRALPWEPRSHGSACPTSSRWCFLTPRLAVQLHHRPWGAGGALVWGSGRQADLDAAR